MAASVEKDTVNEEVVSVELPAPPGWKKKVTDSFFWSFNSCFNLFLLLNFALNYELSTGILLSPDFRVSLVVVHSFRS